MHATIALRRLPTTGHPDGPIGDAGVGLARPAGQAGATAVSGQGAWRACRLGGTLGSMFSGRDDSTQYPRHLPRGLMQVARGQLADRAFQHYLEWRDETTTVECAYGNWVRAARGERTLAFAAYTAALDREEHAALRYGAAIDEAERLLTGAAKAAA